jgi:hypothetical protein
MGQRAWLDPGMRNASVASDLLKPYDARMMRCYPVSTRINHVANDDEHCSAPGGIGPDSESTLLVAGMYYRRQCISEWFDEGKQMTWTEAFKLSEAVTSIATVVLVFLVWQQIRLARKQATTTFEDSLTEQYRGIMENIPTDIWLGSELKALNEERRDRCRDAIYRYIDLSNEQAFLHDKKRVADVAWSEWIDGIKVNMKLPAFAEVWTQVKEKCPESFKEFRLLVA